MVYVTRASFKDPSVLAHVHIEVHVVQPLWDGPATGSTRPCSPPFLLPQLSVGTGKERALLTNREKRPSHVWIVWLLIAAGLLQHLLIFFGLHGGWWL